MDWDDELGTDDLRQWNEIKCDLDRISSCEISRSIGLELDSTDVIYKLLCFCDASRNAYSTAIYLHQSYENQSRCDIVFSKSRLAPVKKMTIPRLELMAVVIGVRCLNFVETELKLPISERFLWSDSRCVLQWMSSRKDLSVFVRNRITEINTYSDVKFGFVQTSENPADVATRGTTTTKLLKNNLWWHGPIWIENKGDSWKQFIPSISEDMEKEYNLEIRRSAKTSDVLLNSDEKFENSPFEIKSENYSSYNKLIRITAWCNRFISQVRKEISCSRKPLTSDELYRAEMMWIKNIQRKHFTHVFSNISTGRTDNLQRQLGIFIQDDGILTCRGRLGNSDLCEGARNPILLPRKDYLTRLLIEKVHKQLSHSGVSQTLGQIRQNYWIPQGRATIRQVIRHCTVCRKFEGGAYKMPVMAPLPRCRVSQSIPFSNIGLD